ncbi:MM0924 family protein [Methanosarcina sp. UBA5]|uniref:MM0924 family protein n=1 Tax=Methanosarcina sp. UBA5 TaxID=1915593 RepID=UPI0025F8AFA4|nr:MM0924 family protein [Methanosarcina sp. UBA5]
MIQSFIVEHYLNKAIQVYCGGPEIFGGTLETYDDNILTLNNEGKLTHVVIDKIIALWAQ